MSDYFAALMRASGLGQAPSTAASAGAELSVLDLEIPMVAAPVGHVPHAPAVRTGTLPPLTTPTGQTAASVITPSPDKPPVVDTPANALASPTLPEAQPQTATSEPVVAHQALVQSVMRWVAGDQPASSTASVSELPSSPATPVLPGEHLITHSSHSAAPTVSTATVAKAQTVEAAPRPHQQLPAAAVPASPDAAHQASAPPQAAAALREQPEPEKTEPTPRDGLSISIGAIHLRVEAPAAPSAPPAAAKPAVQPTAARATTSTPIATARSSLSRRALRHI